jgi:hypothetical protein
MMWLLGICLVFQSLGSLGLMAYVLVKRTPKTPMGQIEDLLCRFTQTFENGYMLGKSGDPGLIGQTPNYQYQPEPIIDPEDEIEV